MAMTIILFEVRIAALISKKNDLINDDHLQYDQSPKYQIATIRRHVYTEEQQNPEASEVLFFFIYCTPIQALADI